MEKEDLTFRDLTFRDLTLEEITSLRKKNEDEHKQRLIDTGKRIKEARLLNKMTQQDLADKIEKTESSIRKYEKGIVDIPFGVLERLATVFHMSSGDLIYGPEENKKLEAEIAYHENVARPANIKHDITEVLASMGYYVNIYPKISSKKVSDIQYHEVTMDSDEGPLDFSYEAYDKIVEDIKDHIQYVLYKLYKEKDK